MDHVFHIKSTNHPSQLPCWDVFSRVKSTSAFSCDIKFERVAYYGPSDYGVRLNGLDSALCEVVLGITRDEVSKLRSTSLPIKRSTQTSFSSSSQLLLEARLIVVALAGPKALLSSRVGSAQICSSSSSQLLSKGHCWKLKPSVQIG